MWFQSDIANILAGIEQASEQMATDRDSEQYRRGFQAAIAAVAVSFGIQPDRSPAGPIWDVNYLER